MKIKPLLASLGLLALFLAGCGRTTAEDIKAIEGNLRQFVSAGHQFMLESGKAEARYGDLVGENKYISKATPVRGEDYRTLVIKADTRSLSVQTHDGQEVRIELSR